MKLLCETSTGESLVTLQNVMYVPGMAANLVSVSRATAAGAKAVFVGECCQLEVDGEVVLEARKSEGDLRDQPGGGARRTHDFRNGRR